MVGSGDPTRAKETYKSLASRIVVLLAQKCFLTNCQLEKWNIDQSHDRSIKQFIFLSETNFLTSWKSIRKGAPAMNDIKVFFFKFFKQYFKNYWTSNNCPTVKYLRATLHFSCPFKRFALSMFQSLMNGLIKMKIAFWMH